MIEKDGQWSLSPGYDLLNVYLANPKDKEELALSLEGEKKKFARHQFERFGAHLGLNNKQINGVFDRIVNNQSKAKNLLESSFLSKEMQEAYWKIMLRRYNALQKK